jgi:hypothetical protein
MDLVKFLSREKLVEYLDEELRIFLNAQEIYEINQYGWLADDRPDPEYLGLAMWQTDPPGSHNIIACIPRITGGLATSPTDLGRIFKTGREFEELMKSSRHSIGLAYLYHKDSDDLGHCYSYHLSDAATKLSRATDRLMAFFSDAASAVSGLDINNQSSSTPGSRPEQHHLYCRQFKQVRDHLSKSPNDYAELLDCIEELIPLIEQTSFYQRQGQDRNNDFLGAENQFSIAPETIAEEPGFTALSDQYLAGEKQSNSMSEWYKLLIKTSNQIFLAEYLIRNSDKNVSNIQIGISL